MKFLLSRFQAYKLQPSTLSIKFKILENSSDKVYWGIPFYRSKRLQVAYRIAALSSCLKNSQESLKVY